MVGTLIKKLRQKGPLYGANDDFQVKIVSFNVLNGSEKNKRIYE